MLHKYSIVQNLKEPMKATEIAVDIVFVSFEKFPRECLHRPRPATLLKKRLWRRCFPVNFVKFLRTPFLQNTSGRLLLSFGLNPFNNFCIGALAFIKNFWILWKCFLDLLFDYTIICSFAVLVTNGTKYSRIGQIKYVEDSL